MTSDVETFRRNVLNHASSGDNIAPPRTDAATTPTDDTQRYKGYRIASTRLSYDTMRRQHALG